MGVFAALKHLSTTTDRKMICAENRKKMVLRGRTDGHFTCKRNLKNAR